MNDETRVVIGTGGVDHNDRRQRGAGKLVVHRGNRHWGRRVGTVVLAVMATAAVLVPTGSTGVAETAIKSVAPTAVFTGYPGVQQGWFKCIAYTGWGFVEVGATVASGPTPWAVAGAISVGMTADQAGKACGWDLMTSNMGYQAFCGSHFIGFDPSNGKPMYDNRIAINNGACSFTPSQLDDIYCNYLHAADVVTCLNQFLYDQAIVYNYWGAPFYTGIGGGGGGGGSW